MSKTYKIDQQQWLIQQNENNSYVANSENLFKVFELKNTNLNLKDIKFKD